MAMSWEDQDTKLLDCNRCKDILNGESFWIVDGTAERLCERCHAKFGDKETDFEISKSS